MPSSSVTIIHFKSPTLPMTTREPFYTLVLERMNSSVKTIQTAEKP